MIQMGKTKKNKNKKKTKTICFTQVFSLITFVSDINKNRKIIKGLSWLLAHRLGLGEGKH